MALCKHLIEETQWLISLYNSIASDISFYINSFVLFGVHFLIKYFSCSFLYLVFKQKKKIHYYYLLIHTIIIFSQL